jgi:ketosteroid isomerase-like protein
MSNVASVVERYYAAVADLYGPEEALLALLDPRVRVVEHPNAINPSGTVRDRDAVVAGYLAGKKLLSEQAFDLHALLVSGQRVAVRATWRGRMARDVGPLRAGAALEAHVAAMITVVGGRIREHETFDCYEPLPAASDENARWEPRAGPG